MQILLSVVALLLLLTGLIYLVSLKGFFLLHPIKTFQRLTRPSKDTQKSPMRALMMALAGTLGVGNIVGVATALSLGGCGAVVWMMLSGLLAMTLKYAEILLAVKHRRMSGDGTHYGGAPYYIKDELNRRGAKGLAHFLSCLFALLCLLNALTMGSMLQANAVSLAMQGGFGISPLVSGGIMALLCFWVSRGGSRQISAVTRWIVPIMTIGFLVMCMAVIALRFERIPHVLEMIWMDAFHAKSLQGGLVGFLTSKGVRYGVMRGVMSNEAGCGTAPMAHVTAQVNTPAEQGVFGLVEVFVDTLLLCSITALAILVSDSGYMISPGNGVETARLAFSSVLGEWASSAFAIAIGAFGVATILCWAHYGMTALGALSRSPRKHQGFRILYALSVLAGAVLTPLWVWDMADVALSLMTILNLFILLLMRREVCRETGIWRSMEGW